MNEWISQNVGWMYWTLPSALFFAGLFVTLVGMTVWDHHSPSIARRGFLPLPTTRGDRLFIGIMSAIGIHLVWIALLGSALILGATLLSVAWFAVVARRG